MKVITLVAIMHENKEISILNTQSVLTDCLSLPDISNESRMSIIHQCLIFDSHPAELLPQFCYLLFRSECFMACMYISLTLCYIRYISLTRTKVFNSKGNCLFIFFLFNSI